jgi:hypothetical protein
MTIVIISQAFPFQELFVFPLNTVVDPDAFSILSNTTVIFLPLFGPKFLSIAYPGSNFFEYAPCNVLTKFRVAPAIYLSSMAHFFRLFFPVVQLFVFYSSLNGAVV